MGKHRTVGRSEEMPCPMTRSSVPEPRTFCNGVNVRRSG